MRSARNRNQNQKKKKLKFEHQNKTIQLDGMENRFLIGFTNFTALVLSLSVKSAVTPLTGVVKHSKSILQNGVTLTV